MKEMRSSLLSVKAGVASSNALPKEAGMKISCSGIGKRFNRDWIFRDFNYEFIQGNKYAITGPNGSGKSTLLQVLAGATIASTGKIHYYLNNSEQEPDKVFNYISIAAPYL